MTRPAAVTGSLLLPAGDGRAGVWAERLELPNPSYVAWKRHKKGKEPEKTVHPLILQDGGPWAGGFAVPRNAPNAMGSGADRRVTPEADALTFAGEVREYQIGAVSNAIAAGEGLIISPTGSGKSAMGCRLMCEYPTPALVICHSKDLALQWEKEVLAFTGESVAFIGFGFGKKRSGDATTARVVVASRATLGRLSWWDIFQKWGKRFGLVIVDECHRAGSAQYMKILAALPARHRFGVTATGQRSDGLWKWVLWSLGPVVAEVDHRELEAAGKILRPRVRFWEAPALVLSDALMKRARRGLHIAISRGAVKGASTFDEAVAAKGFTWLAHLEPHERAQALAEDRGRNGGLVVEARLLAEQGRVILALTQLVSHCYELAEMMCAAGLDAVALVGEMKVEDRALILGRLRDGSVQVVVATSLADEALDVPRVDTAMLIRPTQLDGPTCQKIGRIVRPHEGGQPALVLDVCDKYTTYRRYSAARKRLYRGRGWLS